MTNEEILKKAIEKAVKGGFEKEQGRSFLVIHTRYYGKSAIQECFTYALLFDHTFAKAFWGEKLYMCSYCNCQHSKKVDFCLLCKKKGIIRLWQYHLQQMVVEEEPLKYIERFL